jgi:hypothetical protein
MGKCWLETTTGKLIHLPVVNTPDDPVRIPTSIILNMNRCYSNQIEILSPTYGAIIFDFMQDSLFTGSCNQCGLCCSHPVGNCPHPTGNCGYLLHPNLDYHVCQHLVIDKWRKWGDIGNTECAIYTDILNQFKGCVWPPDTIEPHMINCGFS